MLIGHAYIKHAYIRHGFSANLASLVSLPDEELDLVQQLLLKRNPALAASLAELVDEDMAEEVACRKAAGLNAAGEPL
eukprot:9123530-Pyramimonas_sp.AAC.1